jgi:hypothetical protein
LNPDFGQRVPPLVDYLRHVLERYPDGGQILKVSEYWGEPKLAGENLKVVWAEFSTLSQVVFVISVTVFHRKGQLHPDLKTQPRS